jgi:hypothetical protein
MTRCVSFVAVLVFGCVGCSKDKTPTAPSGPSVSFFVSSATSTTVISAALPARMRPVSV